MTEGDNGYLAVITNNSNTNSQSYHRILFDECSDDSTPNNFCRSNYPNDNEDDNLINNEEGLNRGRDMSSIDATVPWNGHSNCQIYRVSAPVDDESKTPQLSPTRTDMRKVC